MVKKIIIEAIAEVTGITLSDIQLEVPVDEAHGDYSTNVAMKHNDGSPIEAANQIREKLLEVDSLKQYVSDVEVAGPGFINFRISREFLVGNLSNILSQGELYGSSSVGEGKTVLVEYSSPNIAKGFGIGHLRSTVIGDALFNVFKFLGYKVVGENHYGDWGTQFGMVLAQINKRGLDVEKLSVKELEELYVEFNKEMDENPSLRDDAKKWFKKIEDGDLEARRQWEVIRNTSIKEFERIYDILNVHIENSHGEGFYEDKMEPVINEFRSAGLIKKSEGAEIVEFPNMTPAILQKSDGTTTYFTRDLAAIKYRLDTWSPSLIIYEVGSDQILHFRQVFAAAKKIGWNDQVHFEHIAHGLIRFPEGKMSTRKGKTVKLEAVLDEAIARAKNIITKSETNRGLSDTEVDQLAKQIGVGAVKYYDLSHTPQSEIIFDWDKMFVLTGNSGPYLQYTYARTVSILNKSKGENNGETISTNIDGVTGEEMGVIRHLIYFGEVVENVGKLYTPNILANYLYELSAKFNTFYNAHQVVGSNEEDFRLALTKSVGQVLKNGMKILGIPTPDRM